MKKVIKRGLAVALVLIFVLSSFSAQVGVIKTQGADEDVFMPFSVQGACAENNKLVFTVYINPEVCLSGASVYAVYDPDVLSVDEENTGAYMVDDGDGGECENVGGMYAQGSMVDCNDRYVIAHIYSDDVDYKAGATQKPYMTFTFNVNDFSHPDTRVEFYCREYRSFAAPENDIEIGSNVFIADFENDSLHTFGEWVAEKEPTCTQSGNKCKTCSRCGGVYSQSIAPTGHDYSTEWTVDISPTCTTEGSKSHHCSRCGDKGDITPLAALGHKFVLKSALTSHPHTETYECSVCGAVKTEDTLSPHCLECNFDVATTESGTYRLLSYTGTEAEVSIPCEYEGASVTTVGNDCFSGNTFITSVEIEEGVKAIESRAFMNCTSLERVVIPVSVKSMGDLIFCGFSGTVYCVKGSFAHIYAIKNGLKYEFISGNTGETPMQDTENTTVDYENSLIFTSAENSNDITEVLGLSATAAATPVASHTYGEVEFYGTGTVISVYDEGEYFGDFTLIVEGDLNGDSVCDVIDCAAVCLASRGYGTLPGIYATAADCNNDGTVDGNDYQSIVNNAVG
ncbi:MAG: leucine-rich repeat protein [Acutalibacteraceae bacterium]